MPIERCTKLLAACLLVGSSCGCDGAAGGPTAGLLNPEAVQSALTESEWAWSMITAAVCNDEDHAWRFESDGTVEHTAADDVYDYDTGECSSAATVATGTFTTEPDGSVHITLGDDLTIWQVAVLATTPDRIYNDPGTDYATVADVMTTEAYAATAGDGRTFTQRQRSGARETGTTLAFASSLEAGACEISAQVTATYRHDDGSEESAQDTWTFPCAIASIGIDDWMAVSHADDDVAMPEDRPEADYAGDLVRGVREGLSETDGPLVYFRGGAPQVLVPEYTGTSWDSGWMRKVP